MQSGGSVSLSVARRAGRTGRRSVRPPGMTPATAGVAVEVTPPVATAAAGRIPPAATVAALGYLHSNCGHCHGPTHFTGFSAWLQPGLTSPVEALAYQTGVRRPTSGWRDPANPEVIPLRIAPGSPESSSVYLRSGIRGAVQMPPLATEVVHTEGQRILDEWIRNGDFPE